MKAVRRVTLFVLASMIVNFVICMQVATAEQRYPKALEKGQHARACEFQGQQFNQGVIVIASVDVNQGKLVKQQCRNGRWIAISPNDREPGLLNEIKKRTEELSGYNCDQRGGCHCRGDVSCGKLFESRKCQGPITCDPNNPQVCRCP